MKRTMLSNEKVKREIEGLLKMFKEPDSLETVAKSMFRRGINIPSDNWSVLNRLIMMNHGTFDARGPRAWLKIGRKVLKNGSFCIIAPKIWLKPVLDNDGKPVLDKDGKEKKIPILVGFNPIAVWPVENTEGKEVDYKIDKKMPKFIGESIAKKFGIQIKQGFNNPIFYAFYSPTKKEVVIATESQQTFFHELAHICDEKIQGKIKEGQEPLQEIVAEMAAAVLMRMMGLKCGTKNTYDYVSKYAEQLGIDPIDAVIPLISRIGKIVEFIIKEVENEN